MKIRTVTVLDDDRVAEAFEQLLRYGGSPREEIVVLLEHLAELNDDLSHDRHEDILRACAQKIESAMRKIIDDEVASRAAFYAKASRP